MKLFRMCAAIVAALMMSISAADAGGLFSHLKLGGGCGAEKSCGCAETCQPTCCKPTIARPCCTKVFVYQRQCSNIKPPCCDTCCPDTGCCPADAGCGPAACCNAGDSCAPVCCAPAECCAPAACCAPADSCSPDCCCPAPSDCSAPCCAPADCCAPVECCAPAECCVPADCCAPAECCVSDCAAPVDCCAPAECCAPADTCCDTGCEKKCGLLNCSLFSGKHSCLFGGLCKKDDCCSDTCAPADCCAPAECCAPADSCCDTGCEKKCGLLNCSLFSGKHSCLFGGLCKKDDCCTDTCGTTECCETECCEIVAPCCPGDPCLIALLIYKSQTACYAKDRKDAIDELGDDYNCRCNPEIMCAFIYALNDTDERVRKEAADEIGDQIRKNGCCCTPELVAALTCALGDCDKGVRKQAEEALEACGYEIVDGCCNMCGDACGTGCAPGCAPGCSPAQEMEAAPMMDKAAPPAPPVDSEVNFRSKLNIRSVGKKGGLANLFGLAK